MTANIIINNYYYRYRQQRKNCKDLVDANNLQQAKTILQNSIIEHQNTFPNSDTRRDFNWEEKLKMKHALDHLTVFENHTNLIDQRTATITALDEI